MAPARDHDENEENPPQPASHEPRHDGAEGHAHSMPMGQRGVTRPMAEMEQHSSGAGHDKHHNGGMEMTPEHRHHMLHQHHRQTLWVYWTVVLLGAWTMLSPVTFAYSSGVVAPAGGRDLWLSNAGRIAVMTWSDLISGALLLIFGWRALTPNRPISLWICCFVGVWLTFAPVLFWAPNAAAYLNATLVGMLVMALTVLIPGMPNMIAYMKMGGAQPAGWSYNPSSWPQRSILIALAFAGWATSRYLAAYQLGYIDEVWEPFFGPGSRLVLESNMSEMWPVSDAAFGALAYTLEFLMGYMGATSRWRTMPWMVTFFGILVIPLGLVHIALVISQPVIVGQWCTFCLLAAAIMLPMIPLAVDEVVAMCQHLKSSRQKGVSFWEAFWKGGPAGDATPDERSPEMIDLPQRPRQLARASWWGMSVPWTLLVSVVLGIVLMATPAWLGIAAPTSHVFHLGGSLAVVFAVIAMGEPIRLTRYFNILVGLVIAGAPFMMDASLGARLAGLIGGLVVAALAFPRGPIRESYGAWDRFVR
jgi:hypothetical protein